mgnify:CR=1 FL=1
MVKSKNLHPVDYQVVTMLDFSAGVNNDVCD